ncbi:hypothetical protein McanCB49686_003180 [Microsporum canis]
MADATEIGLATLERIIERKREAYEKLQHIFTYFRSAKDKDSIYFSHKKLQEHNIRVSAMDLEHGGKYFRPVSTSEFKTWAYDEGKIRELQWSPDNLVYRDAERIYRRCWELIISEIPDSQSDDLIPRTRMGGNFANLNPDELTDWLSHTALDTYESRPSESHVISFSSHGLRPDKSTESKLARSEILVAVDIIMHRMRWPPSLVNHTCPVLMISCFNRQVRMNEVYFEDGNLHFNCTPFLDMEVFDRSQCELLVRWSVSNPVGETTAYPNLKALPEGYEKFGVLRKSNKQSKRSSKPKPVQKRLEELKRG